MTTMFKHLKPNEPPGRIHVAVCFPIAPSMTTIVVDRVTIVNKQITAIVRNQTPPVMTPLKNSQASGPTHSKVIVSGETRPPAASIPVVNVMLPTSHIWPTAIEVLAATALTKVECVLHEQTMAIRDGVRL
jgi:hypothetical protein